MSQAIGGWNGLWMTLNSVIPRQLEVTGPKMTTEIRRGEEKKSRIGESYSPEHLPPEVAFLLLLIGIAAVPLPGPGIPFIVAGGLVLWPRTFKPVNHRLQTSYPEAHASVFRVLERFENDLNRRYPKPDA
jgi:hypothetical protein